MNIKLHKNILLGGYPGRQLVYIIRGGLTFYALDTDGVRQAIGRGGALLGNGTLGHNCLDPYKVVYKE